MLRFNRIDDDEGTKQKKKYEESLKSKKEQLRQEFEHLEGIRKSDEQSVKSGHDFKFKAELDKLQSLNQQKRQQLLAKEKQSKEINLEQFQLQNTSRQDQQQQFRSSMFRSSTSNHHSDPLFQTLSRNLKARSPEDLVLFKDELISQQLRYDDLILEEEEREESLKATLNKMHHSKLLLVQEIQSINYLNKVADSRFANTQSLQFLAKEKKVQSQGNLNSIKGELKEMKRMRDTFKRNQEEKQNEVRKDIHVGEEYVSHTGMKIEEAEQKIKDLNKQLERIESEERIIIKRKQKSKYIIDYIDCFEQFEEIFMNEIEDPEEGTVRIVDKYYVNEDQLDQIQQMIDEPRQNFASRQDSHEVSSLDISNLEVFDRNQLLTKINNFFMQADDRTKKIINFMFEKYWQLKADVELNNTTYENMLREKGKLKQYLELLEHDLEDISTKNAYLKNELTEPETEVKHEEEMVVDNRNLVAFDAGLIQQKNSTTTLNIFTLEVGSFQEKDILAIKVQKNHNLLFNFLLSLVELLHRSSETLKIISSNSYNMMTNDIDQHCNICLDFLKGIWNHRNNLLLHQSSKGSAKLADCQEDQEFEQQINQHQIDSIFRDIFLETSPAQRKISSIIGKKANLQEQMEHLQNVVGKASQEFYLSCKQDQILWFYLDPIVIRDFLLPIKSETQTYFKNTNHALKLTQDILIPSSRLDQLRSQSIEVFIANLRQLLDYYQIFQEKLKMLRFDLKIFLKEKDPKFDAIKLKYQPVRDGASIKEARIKVLNKQDFYKTGETKANGIVPNLFGKKSEGAQLSENLLMKGIAKVIQPELNMQLELFLNDEKKNHDVSEEQIQMLRNYFRSKLQHKYESSLVINKKLNEDVKKKDNQKSVISEVDELEEERNQLKEDLQQEWNRILLEREQKGKPQEIQPQNEKKLLIKEVTERLYGDRGGTAQTLKAMSMTTGILSDIDRLEKQPSAIEQPNIISNYKLQKKNMHRNLNKELTLPSLGFLKPTSAYFSRRNQSQEQLRALAQKKYDLIESGMALPTTTTSAGRPRTDQHARSVPKMFSSNRNKINERDIEKFYQRYGSPESSENFVGYLLKQQNMMEGMNLQEFAFPQTRPTLTSQGQRPKSILVQPSI